jgi:enoyl-CoA hydratase/carnithine racemase
MDLIWEHVASWLSALWRMLGGSPAAKGSLGVVIVVIALVVVAHLVLSGYLPGMGDGARWSHRGGRGGQLRDPRALAKALALEGRYTEAAHALYVALLDRVAARVPLRLHPSKTAGDYARDLRGTAPSVFGPFREFARRYELVIYGIGSCDRSLFEQLLQLAGRIEPELGSLA